ncbi:MAG TPA: 4-alpha-glucanotransferase [Bryobacteraceae bacterium]|jgi:4-alpha-glucanotransferase|nr:4-alpha-glucanotransferase [Bryobacteraceae bacterium]
MDTNGWGIDLSYEDAFGNRHETPRETITALLASMDADLASLTAPKDDTVVVVRCGEQKEFASMGTVALETGETVVFEKRLPIDLPTGYHQLLLDRSERPSRLIVSPGKCWLPEHLQTWGWAVQLYAARSAESWGIGDFYDLHRLAEWSRSELGAGMMMVNPLSAATPITPQQASPYFPTSRRFFNPLWIHIEWVPNASAATVPQLQEIANAGRELNSQRRIQRDRVFELKMRALELLWLQFAGDEAFDRYCAEQGSDLDRFAVFCTLAEKHQSGWHNWPSQFQHPDNQEVARFARDNEPRIRFHKWLQWLLDAQLARCSEQLALMQDLPIGVDPDGADAWAWQDVIAKNAGVGAPPDEFNTQGQSWGLPPFVPHKLRAAGYEPFVQTIRAAFRHGGGLRIDHVMGLFRLFWIPDGMPPAQGAYVRYDADELLAIVALESERARAYVVGEDLGTVEHSAREKLAQHHILSYRLLWFEKDDPAQYPREALAAVTTHDLPTIAGLWTGSDLARQRELKLKPNEESTAEIHTRLTSMAGVSQEAPVEEVIEAAYRLLARAPSRILTAALDDAAKVEERPNLPATTEEQNPNWSIALPIPIEQLMTSPLPCRIAKALGRLR